MTRLIRLERLTLIAGLILLSGCFGPIEYGGGQTYFGVESHLPRPDGYPIEVYIHEKTLEQLGANNVDQKPPQQMPKDAAHIGSLIIDKPNTKPHTLDPIITTAIDKARDKGGDAIHLTTVEKDVSLGKSNGEPVFGDKYTIKIYRYADRAE